jgi:hypothetical protein
MSTDGYWTEKLDPNVMMIIIHKVFRLTAHYCICERPVMQDLRNRDMRNLQLTCRTWYSRWRNFAVYLCIRGIIFCGYPVGCWRTYSNATPRLPLLRRQTAPNERRATRRVYRNGRVLVIEKSASAETPGEGTLH